MDWRRPLVKMSGNYRMIDKKALNMRNSWQDVEKLLNGVGQKKKSKPESEESRKDTKVKEKTQEKNSRQ